MTTGQEQKDAASIVGAETEQQLQEARMEKVVEVVGVRIQCLQFVIVDIQCQKDVLFT